MWGLLLLLCGYVAFDISLAKDIYFSNLFTHGVRVYQHSKDFIRLGFDY